MFATYALEGVIAFGLLGLVIYGPWQWACTDAARQRLFFLRDQLFDIARSGRLSFDSDEYRTLREAFDSQIRFAHVLNIVRVLMFRPFVRHMATKPTAARLALTRIENQSTRAEVTKLIDSMDQTLALVLVAKSPVLLFFSVAVAMLMIIYQSLRSIFRGSVVGNRQLIAEAITKSIRKPAQIFAPFIHDEAAAFLQ
jgi:hypothetical protein